MPKLSMSNASHRLTYNATTKRLAMCVGGGVTYRVARYCPTSTGVVSVIAMTSTDAATFPNAFFLPGIGCAYFNFSDPTYSSPPGGTTLYSAGDATAQADCTACLSTPCHCPDLPLTLNVNLPDTTSWNWLAGTPCSPSVAQIPCVGFGGCNWVSASVCVGGGLVNVVIASDAVSSGTLAVTFVPSSGPAIGFTRAIAYECDVYGSVPLTVFAVGETPSPAVIISP